MYRVKAVAEMLDVSTNTIYRAIESGALDALKIGTGKGTIRIPGRAIRAYVNACSEAAYQSYVRLGENPAADDDAGADTAGYRPDALSGAQADGMACLVCKADFLNEQIPNRPLGHSYTGAQVFVCSSHNPTEVDQAANRFAVTGRSKGVA